MHTWNLLQKFAFFNCLIFFEFVLLILINVYKKETTMDLWRKLWWWFYFLKMLKSFCKKCRHNHEHSERIKWKMKGSIKIKIIEVDLKVIRRWLTILTSSKWDPYTRWLRELDKLFRYWILYLLSLSLFMTLIAIAFLFYEVNWMSIQNVSSKFIFLFLTLLYSQKNMR